MGQKGQNGKMVKYSLDLISAEGWCPVRGRRRGVHLPGRRRGDRRGSQGGKAVAQGRAPCQSGSL